MERAKNDATLSKLGDIYQYYLALKECFEMLPNEIVYIETYGDVSRISKNNSSIQKEIKHHINDRKLTDRDVDFWKTLKNWVSDIAHSDMFSSLILFTTAEIDIDSPFFGWNSKSISEKMRVIEAIGLIIKSEEKGFRDLYTQIFNSSGTENQNLKKVLNKFTIETLQPKIKDVSKLFEPHVKMIPEVNRDAFIASLLGIVLSKVKEPPYKWEISYQVFETLLQSENKKFSIGSQTPLPTEYSDQAPNPKEEKGYKEKTFVKEIEKIDYSKMVPSAIRDYWRMGMTVRNYFMDNIIHTKDIPLYKDNLKSKLFHTKAEKQVEFLSAERKTQLLESKKMYSCIMAWNAEDFGSVCANQSYFQNGVIHEIVDDGKFTWDIGDEDEC